MLNSLGFTTNLWINFFLTDLCSNEVDLSCLKFNVTLLIWCVSVVTLVIQLLLSRRTEVHGSKLESMCCTDKWLELPLGTKSVEQP